MRVFTEVLDRLRRAQVCVRATGAGGSSIAALIAEIACARPKVSAEPIVVVTADDDYARRLAGDVRFYLRAVHGLADGDVGAMAEYLPAPDASPYAEAAADPATIGARLALLFRVTHGLGPAVLCASAESLSRRTMPRPVFEARCHHVAPGETIERDAFAANLVAAGYERTSVVEDSGTFAVRGAVIDVFPQLYRFPARVEWNEDSVETVRLFDAASQRTLRKLPDLFVHPARDTIRTSDRLRERLVAIGDALDVPSSRVRQLVEHLEAGDQLLGVGRYLPAFHDRLDTVFDYLPESSLLVVAEPDVVAQAARDAEGDVRDAYESRREDQTVVFPPEDHAMSAEQLQQAIARHKRLEVHGLPIETSSRAAEPGPEPESESESDSVQIGGRPLDDLAAELRLARASDDPLAPLRARLASWQAAQTRVVVQLANQAQQDRLRGLLLARDTLLPPVALGDLSAGFATDEWVVVAEEEIFGPRAHKRASSVKRMRKTDLADLAIGDLIVHSEHGIGRYRGLVTMDVADVRGDFLYLEYEGGKLYLPIARLSQVERYRGGEGDSIRLDRLGGQSFARRKTKATVDAQALAEELLQIYAQRKSLPGHAHPEPDALFGEFEATFPYEETTDQTRAIGDVLGDLVATRPMDRLVCGDVGFGKTEVALRAAFLVASAGKQVAVLAPTTVLVEQHVRTFRDRLSAWPLRVEGLSRFRTRPEQAVVIRDLAEGKVDIVVGTHRLLQADVRFRDLGLIVLDEEHRFGVAHKERLKKMRAEVDVLAMTATPIPRTLHMALGGMRDLSIISTPPEDRLSVRTLLCRTEDSLIRDAIRKEIARRGQVFFVHNRIESMGPWVAKVRELVPEARIGVAHGQLAPTALEKVMVDFVQGDLDVLVTTAIIESGLDIPRANTMLVHRADMLGLAQLYQLRGRIGRGPMRAFCYLLIDSEKLPGDARRRLEAVVRHSELGSGFALATTDLDIRGAGELLGAKQSGHIAALGFETYARILEEAVAERRGEPIQRRHDPEVTCDLSAYIPEAYVEDAGQRLDLYKRFAHANDDDDIAAILEELRDRYGPEPEEVGTLAGLMACKAIARGLGAVSLEIARGRVALAIGAHSPLDPGRIATLVQRRGSGWRITPDGRVIKTVADAGARFTAARSALAELAGCGVAAVAS